MSATERLVLDLPAELVSAVRTAVKSGDFASESDFVRTLLQTWLENDVPNQEELQEIRRMVAEGIAEADAGLGIEADKVFDELEARYEAMIAKRDS